MGLSGLPITAQVLLEQVHFLSSLSFLQDVWKRARCGARIEEQFAEFGLSTSPQKLEERSENSR